MKSMFRKSITAIAVTAVQAAHAVSQTDHGRTHLADDRAADHLGCRHVPVLLLHRRVRHFGRRCRHHHAGCAGLGRCLRSADRHYFRSNEYPLRQVQAVHALVRHSAKSI